MIFHNLASRISDRRAGPRSRREIYVREHHPAAARALIAVATSLLLLMTGCARKHDYLQDVAGLDKTLIPALSFASDGKPADARTALKRFSGDWKDFYVRYRSSRPLNQQWTAGLDWLDRSVRQANRFATNDSTLPQTRDQLQSFRVGLMLLRHSDTIVSVPDYLTDFYGPLNAIAMSVRNQKPESLPMELLTEMLEPYREVKRTHLAGE